MFIVPTLTISGALYVAPRALEYFSTKPDEILTRVDQLREKMANLVEASKKIVGERTWFVITDVFAKNAWVSFLAICCLTRNSYPFATVNQGIETVSTFFVFCTATAFAKYATRLFLPTGQT